MGITLQHLDYELNALEPAISARTMEIHYGRHYAGYVATLATLIKGTEFERLSLDEIVHQSNGKPDLLRQTIFNNAAQIWNHEFFWNSLAPNGGGAPPEPVRRALDKAFGSVDAFKEQFVEAGSKQFGSGWAWLVAKDDGLHIMTTGNAQIPPHATCRPLLVCDLWEHAYYLDYQNERGAFLKAFLDKLVNWQFVGQCMESKSQRAA